MISILRNGCLKYDILYGNNDIIKDKKGRRAAQLRKDQICEDNLGAIAKLSHLRNLSKRICFRNCNTTQTVISRHVFARIYNSLIYLSSEPTLLQRACM